MTGTGTWMGTGTRTGIRAGTGTGMGKGTGTKTEGEREPGNLRSDIGGTEEPRGGPTPMSNQQPRPQEPTPQQDRCIMRRARAQGREARNGTVEGEGGATKPKNFKKSYTRHVEHKGDLS